MYSQSETRILLENTAGAGSCLGRSPEELKLIIDGVLQSDRVGICIDTQHAFAAGYAMSTEGDYRNYWKKIERTVGIRKVMAFHLNDSKSAFGSNIDRHAHIGKGYLKSEVFKLLLNDKRFRKCPMSLETPKQKNLKEDIQALQLLRSWVKR